MPTDKRPNIMLIVSDDHGLESSCYGNPVIQTPNMDALAEDGVRFSHSFCTASTCSPSRAVILTGLHNHANGQYGLQHSYHHFESFDNIKSLPVLLDKADYRTAHIGKFHIAPREVYQFDHFLKGNGRSPVMMAEKCREFITSDDEQPFFLYYCTNDPHRSGNVAEDLPGKPNRFGNRDEGYPEVETITYDPEDVIVPPCLPDNIESRAELAQYYQSVSRLDQGIGRLTQILKKSGKYENTLMIYISDNGFAFPEAKTTLYEDGMRLPCIVRSPFHNKLGGVCNAMMNWADITPTILDFADAMPEDIDFNGRSFRSVIDEDEPEGWDEVYASHTFHEVTMYYPMRVVRTRKYKFIWNIAHPLEYPFASDLWNSSTWQSVEKYELTHFGKRSVDAYLHRPRFELYNLENDPHEINNLAEKPEYATVVEDLKRKLKSFQKETNDPWILKWRRE